MLLDVVVISHTQCIETLQQVSEKILLMQDGMQWELFQKFVSKLEKHCEIIAIGSEIDYRRLIAQRCMDQVRYYHGWFLLYLLSTIKIFSLRIILTS